MLTQVKNILCNAVDENKKEKNLQTVQIPKIAWFLKLHPQN